MYTTNGSSQAFGAGDSLKFFDNENGVLLAPFTQGSSRHNNVAGSNGIGTSGYGVNMFKDPEAAFKLFRNPILGLDTRGGGTGILRGLSYWNVDLSLRKNLKVTERINLEFQTVFANVLNHCQFGNPILDLSNPAAWGRHARPGKYSADHRVRIAVGLLEAGEAMSARRRRSSTANANGGWLAARHPR